MLLRTLLIFMGFLFISQTLLNGQDLRGKLLDNVSQKPVVNAVVHELITDTKVITDQNGQFQLESRHLKSEAQIDILIEAELFEPFRIQLSHADWNSGIQEFYLIPKFLQLIEPFEVVSLETDEDDNSSDVYSLLSSSRDPILKAAAYQFSSFRYRVRGMPVHFNQLGMNGFLLNNPISDYTAFYMLSGQNNLTRYNDNVIGYKENEFGFGSAGLGQWIQSEAHSSRKDLVINYALSNRNYSNRIGIHYASGQKSSAWAIMAGANRRWAEEGFIEGSYYDAWGSYFGLSKSIGDKHRISLLAIYAPVERGKASPATLEVYDLSNDHYYNSYWGFQSGEKRNSRISNSSIPLVMLNYQWKPKDHVIIHSGLMASSGTHSDTRIDRFNASDPRPDYYQKLPSYIKVPAVAGEVANAWRTQINVRQLNWAELYEANYHNLQTIIGVNGRLEDTIKGKRAVYWMEEKHYDPSEMEHYTNVFWNMGRSSIQGGYRLELAEEKNYLKLIDLFGADFMLDLEDFVTNEEFRHPDIRKKNHIIGQNDRYGYEYSAFVTQLSSHIVYSYKAKKFDFSVGGGMDRNSYYREGTFQNAIFTNSLGTSETVHQNGYGVKSTLTWKINGRNYIRWNGGEQKLPNRFDQVFVNPQWRADVLNYNEQTKIQASDLSYFYRSPDFKLQFTAYYIQLQNQIVNKNFYLDQQLESSSNVELADGGFINAFYTGLDQRHIGLESAVEWNVGRGFNVSLVYNLGDHIYTSRPEFLIFDKYSQAFSKHIIYLKNFYVPGSAQQAVSGAIKYNFKRSGFIELSINYLDQQYLEPNPLRRIEAAVEDVDRNSPVFRQIIDQEKLPSSFYLNLYLYKGFRIDKHYLNVSLGVNNILNATDLISGGFEQFRFDYETKDPNKFPSKYYYYQGFNFYLGFNLRI